MSARFAKVRKLQDRPALHLLCQPTVRNLDARARMHARRVVQTTIPSAQQCKQLAVSGISDDAATARSCPFSHVALHEVHAAQHSRREMGDVHRTPSASFLQSKSPLPLRSAPQRCVDESSDEIHESSETPTLASASVGYPGGHQSAITRGLTFLFRNSFQLAGSVALEPKWPTTHATSTASWIPHPPSR